MTLRQKLAAAKAAHAACRAPCLAPHALAIHAAQQWLEKYAPQARNLDAAPAKQNAGEITRDQLNQRRQILADRDAVLAYRVKKSALAQVVADVQQELYAASQPSDLE